MGLSPWEPPALPGTYRPLHLAMKGPAVFPGGRLAAVPGRRPGHHRQRLPSAVVTYRFPLRRLHSVTISTCPHGLTGCLQQRYICESKRRGRRRVRVRNALTLEITSGSRGRGEGFIVNGSVLRILRLVITGALFLTASCSSQNLSSTGPGSTTSTLNSPTAAPSGNAGPGAVGGGPVTPGTTGGVTPSLR